MLVLSKRPFIDVARKYPKDPLNPLIDILSQAISQYEMQDEELAAFVSESNGIHPDLALVRELRRILVKS